MIKRESVQDISRTLAKEYGNYILHNRALPHLDCKPIHRRLLYSLIRLGARQDKRYMKSQSVMGECAKLHAHGMDSAYQTLVNMVNSPNSLVQGRGNWGGGIFNDPSAAPRYTEVRTSELFEALIDDYSPDLIPYVESYDGSGTEPALLPFKLPVPFLLGMIGIGFGLSSSIPAYHISYIKEMIQKTMFETPIDELMESFSYKGALVNSKLLYPYFEYSGKKFIITELPETVSIKPLLDNKTFNELINSGNIKFEDRSELNAISLSFETSEDIFYNFILKSLTRRPTENLYFIAGRIRRYPIEFLKIWLEHRVVYNQKRSIKTQLDKNSKIFKQKVFNKLDKTENVSFSNFKSYIRDIVSAESMEFISSFDKSILTEFEISTPDLDTLYYELIKSSLSSIRSEVTKPYELIKIKPDRSEMYGVIWKQIDEIPVTLFSRKTRLLPTHIKSIESTPLEKYVYFKDGKVVVSYKQPQRISSFLSLEIQIFAENGDIHKVKTFEIGEYEVIGDSKVIGFSVGELRTVLVTQDNRVSIRSVGLHNLNVNFRIVFPLTDEIKTDKGIITKKLFVKGYGKIFKPLKDFEWVSPS